MFNIRHMWHLMELFDLISVIKIIKINCLDMIKPNYNAPFDYVANYIYIRTESPKQMEANCKFHVFICCF